MLPDVSQHSDVLHAPATVASIKLNTASLVAESYPQKHTLIFQEVGIGGLKKHKPRTLVSGKQGYKPWPSSDTKLFASEFLICEIRTMVATFQSHYTCSDACKSPNK